MFKPLPECRGPALGDMREAFVISFNPRARSKAVFAPFGERQIKRHAHGKIRTEGGIHRQAHCLYADIYRGFRRDDADIGRASCRERVCMYVWDWVVDV